MSDEAPANRKQFVVRNASSHRVVHTTNQGLTSVEAAADAEAQLEIFIATHPEQAFEVVAL